MAKKSSPSSPIYMRALIRALGDVEGRRALDVGCGKGHAMRMLRQAAFARVDGIEMSDQLVDIANANLRGRARRRSTVLRADARTFDSYGDYDVLYLFNPFFGEVMTDFARAVREQHPGDLTLVYNTPFAEAELLAELPLERVVELPAAGGNRIVVFRLPGSGPGGGGGRTG